MKMHLKSNVFVIVRKSHVRMTVLLTGWKPLDPEPAEARGRKTCLADPVVQKLHVVVHSLLDKGVGLGAESFKYIFEDVLKKEGVPQDLSVSWTKAFLKSSDLSYKAGEQTDLTAQPTL